MSLWHDVLYCKDDPRTEDRHQDIRVAAFSATLLAIVVGLFYAGSYIQTEQAQTQLIQCVILSILNIELFKLRVLKLIIKTFKFIDSNVFVFINSNMLF